MSDLMFHAVLTMPYDMAMSDELSRRQFYDRVQEAVQRVVIAENRVADLEAQLAAAPNETLVEGITGCIAKHMSIATYPAEVLAAALEIARKYATPTTSDEPGGRWVGDKEYWSDPTPAPFPHAGCSDRPACREAGFCMDGEKLCNNRQ